jgi:hypothetical protein
MSNLEAHAEVVGPIVEQQNGEDAVVNDGADKIGRTLQ